ncbi:3-oxoadipate enol-lactonase 2 [compost metagenome]
MDRSTWNISTISLNGQALRVGIRPGKQHMVPLLLFNGIGASLELVAPFVDALDPAQEVIIFDVPGVGGSPAPLLPYRFSGISKLTANVLDHFGYGQVHALGVSWGGFLAQQFAKDYPYRCLKLVLAATASGVIGVPGNPKLGLVMASPRRYIDSAYAERVMPDIYGGSFRRDKALVKAYAGKIKPTSRRGYVYQLAALSGWTSLPWLHRVRQPTLVLAGDDDPLIPLINARLLAWCLPNSELHVINDGHLFLITQAKKVSGLITEFLDRDTEASVAYATVA